MKKLCVLLAIITLLSCCLIGCSNSKSATETEPTIDWQTLDRAAEKEAVRLIKKHLLDPDSYKEHSCTYKDTVSEDSKYIYFRILVDYTATNSMGGPTRTTEAIYLRCEYALIGMPKYTTPIKFTKVDPEEVRDNGGRYIIY